MHPAFSNGFLIEIQYTAIVFNRAQRAPASHGWFSTNAVPEILILVPFLGGGAPPINKVLGLVYYIVCYIVVYIYIHIYIVYIVFYCQLSTCPGPGLRPRGRQTGSEVETVAWNFARKNPVCSKGIYNKAPLGFLLRESGILGPKSM